MAFPARQQPVSPFGWLDGDAAGDRDQPAIAHEKRKQ
jgi:hypothetical protein